MPLVVLVRFLEYIFIGYLLIGIRIIIHSVSRSSGKNTSE